MSRPTTAVPRATSSLLALLVVLLGLGARLLLPDAVGGPLGDALYATLVVLLVALLRPRTAPVVAAAVGLAVSAAVELAQLTDVPAQIVARVPEARFVLGTTFVASDLAWYAAGAAAGGALLALVAPRAARVDRGLRHVTAPAGPRRRRRATVVVPVVIVLLLGAAGGWLAWTLHDEAGTLTAQVTAAQASLDASADRVADDAVRPALAASIDRAEALLAATPLLERRPGDAPEAGRALARDVAAVDRSRLEHARAQVAEGRDALAPVTRRAKEVVAAVDELADDGRGADKKARSAAGDALAAARDALASSADDALDADDLPAVEAAAQALGASRDDLDRATTDLMTAQDAVVCPEPDQLWFPQAGRLDAKSLAPLPWAPQYSVRADVLDGLVSLDAAYRAEFGQHLTVNSAYRTYDQQVAVYDPAHPNPLAAPPGCSNHGLGTAVDVAMGPEGFDGARYAWLKEHAAEHGWTHPDWAEPDGRLPEPWHWQSVKTPVDYDG
ncbi:MULTISPECIES: DUF2809 domain-containing protein [unclassified Isoptericola]|uniref:DUF2809 domain-containing protein n=1 Tax=unclassified Isoptericola TaxID=2623355 RepID=UPI003656558D